MRKSEKMPAEKGPFDRDLNRETKEVQLLTWILAELKLQTHLLREINCNVIALLPEPAEVDGFTIQQTGDSPMGTTPPVVLTPPDPGATLQFTATPTPAGAVLPSGVVPTWVSSDTTNVTITTDPTGLIATVVLGAAIPVGESVTLTITATLPDGTTPTGSATFTVGAAPPVEVSGFTVIQTA
jgi:hypothetical protein